MNNDVKFGTGIGVGIVSTLTLALMFLFGFVVGEESGITRGEEKTALIAVQAFNKIKQQLPKDTKINAAVALSDAAQQKRVLFQHTYNKNLECRQALRREIATRVNEICGPVPQIKDF